MRRIFAILVPAGLVAALLGTSPASAQVTPTIDIVSATVVANGDAVVVTHTLTCEAGWNAFFITDVTQGAGRHVAQGQGYVDFIYCTGEPQVFTPTVEASGTIPFHPGPATVTTVYYACTPLGECEPVQVTEEIKVSAS